MAISGAGVLWAGGSGLDSLAELVERPRPHARELRRIRSEAGAPLFGAEVADDLIHELAPARANRGADRFGKLNVAGVRATLAAAGFTQREIEAGCLAEVGLVLSTTFGPWESINQFVLDLIDEGPMETSPRLFPNTVPNSAQGRVAMSFGMKGPSTTLTGLPALTHAYDLYTLGRASQLVAGGADELNANVLTALSDDGSLAPQSEHACLARPFDPQSPGATAGEAFAGFFCESVGSAQRRGAAVLGTMLGYGIASDGRLAESFAQADPEGLCFQRAMQGALASARLLPGDIDAVVAAANGCPGLDRGERCALKLLFGGSQPPIVSPKATTGECFGASSALATAAGLVLLREGGVRNVLVSSVDLGGNVTAVVLARAR